MIGHEAIGQQTHGPSRRSLGQKRDERLIITIGMKHLGLAIPTIDDVIADASYGSPCSTRHTGHSPYCEWNTVQCALLRGMAGAVLMS